MSNCGYYSCFKGKPTCKHPTYGAENTRIYGRELAARCKTCRRSNNGIYPNNLPSVDFTKLDYDVLDKSGKVIVTIKQTGDK